MAFNFGLENFNVIETSDTDASLETLLFDVAESMESMIDDETRLTTCLENIDGLEEAINNMVELEEVIATEGISAGLLALFNKDNALAYAIGREIAPLTADNVKEVSQVCQEGLKENIKKGYEKVKEFFRKMIKWVKDFFAGMFNVTKRQLNACGKIKEELPKWVDKADETAFGKKEVKAFKHDEFIKYVAEVAKLRAAVESASLAEMKLSSYESTLKTFGYNVEDDKLKKAKDTFGPEKAKSLSDLGWKLGSLNKGLEDTITMLKGVSALQSKEKKFAADMDAAIKKMDNFERLKDESAIKSEQESIDMYKKNAVVMTQLMTTYGKAVRVLASQAITICGKAQNAKKEKEEKK